MIMCLSSDLLFIMCLYKGPFIYYLPIHGLVVHHVPLLGPFVYYASLK